MAASSSVTTARNSYSDQDLDKAILGRYVSGAAKNFGVVPQAGDWDGWKAFSKELLGWRASERDAKQIFIVGERMGPHVLQAYIDPYLERDVKEDAQMIKTIDTILDDVSGGTHTLSNMPVTSEEWESFESLADEAGIPETLVARIRREWTDTYESPTLEFLEIQLSRYGEVEPKLKAYQGSSYYQNPGESEETLQEDALKIARAIRDLGNVIPKTETEWQFLARRLYVNGIPYQVNQEIYVDGVHNPKHPVLSHYLNLAGIPKLPTMTHASDFYADDTQSWVELDRAQIIADVVDDWLAEHGGKLPKADDRIGWDNLATNLNKFFLDDPHTNLIEDEAVGGSTTEINRYLGMLGKAPVYIENVIPDYSELEEERTSRGLRRFRLISMDQIRDAYRSDRLTENQYLKAVKLFQRGRQQMLIR